MANNLIPIEIIKNKIYFIRGQKVMLDRDLAELYGVETRVLKQSVKRNINRFPDDFMFKLTNKGIDSVVSQFMIPPKSIFSGAALYAFAEHGDIMKT